MATDVKAGSADYAIAISEEMTGAAGSEVPDGDVVYLFAQKVKVSTKNIDKRKILSLQKQKKIITGKVDMVVQLQNCTVSKEEHSTSTAEINAIVVTFNDWGFKQGSDKVYLWIYNTADSTYVKAGIDSSGDAQRYTEGYILNYDYEMMKGKLFMITNLVFGQVN